MQLVNSYIKHEVKLRFLAQGNKKTRQDRTVFFREKKSTSFANYERWTKNT